MQSLNNKKTKIYYVQCSSVHPVIRYTKCNTIRFSLQHKIRLCFTIITIISASVHSCFFGPTTFVVQILSVVHFLWFPTQYISQSGQIIPSKIRLFITCRAKSAKTIRQNIVSVITSANCLNECSNAFMMVLRPAKINSRR